jgi:hypothetical protein
MKSIQKILNPFILFSLLAVVSILVACNSSRAFRSINNAGELSNAIDSSRWTFTPTQVSPQSGITRQVNGTYFATLNKKQLIVYLPYFGNAFGGADVMQGKNPLDFSSTNFTINKTQNKKGKWRISIIPADHNPVQELNFIFFDNGSASLNINLASRSGIRYEGNLTVPDSTNRKELQQ